MTRVLVVGMPRSGSTWTAEILGLAEGTRALQEPDNPDNNPAAVAVRSVRGWHPTLEVGQAAPDYQRLWDLAFAGGWPKRGECALQERLCYISPRRYWNRSFEAPGRSRRRCAPVLKTWW